MGSHIFSNIGYSCWPTASATVYTIADKYRPTGTVVHDN